MLQPTRSSEGFRLLSLGQLAEAEAEFRNALQSDPKDVKCLLGLARSLQAQGQIEEALGTLNQLFAARPDHLEARSLRGLLLTMKGDPRGLKDLEDAAKDRRSGAQEHMNFGLYLAEKDDARAQKEFELALRVDARNSKAYVELGRIAERRQDLRAALVQYQKASDFAVANDPTPYFMKAKAHAALGEHRHAAVAALEAVTRAQDGQKPELLPDSFRICMEAGEYDTAVKIALAALELDSQNAEYQTWMAKASMGTRQAGTPNRTKDKKDIFDEEEISQVSKKAVSSTSIPAAGGKPAEPGKFVHLDQACQQAEAFLFKDPPQTDEAIKVMDPALKQAPDNPRANLAMGLALALKGDYQRGLVHAQKALISNDASFKQEAEALVKACEKKLRK